MYTVIPWALFAAGAVDFGVIVALDFNVALPVEALDDGGACSFTLDALLFTVIVFESEVNTIVLHRSVR